MTTAAFELSQLLSAMYDTPKDANFLDSLADHLGFDGPGKKIEALATLQNLILLLNHQVESCLDNEESAKLAVRLLKPFQPIINFSQLNHNISEARKNYLGPECIVNLNRLHSLLSGHADLIQFPKGARELAAKFAASKAEINTLDLPEDAKRALLERVSQISTLLENANTFGPARIKRELEALLGAIFVNVSETKGPTKDIVAKVLILAMGGLTLLQEVDESMQSAISIKSNMPEFIDVVHGVVGHEAPPE